MHEPPRREDEGREEKEPHQPSLTESQQTALPDLSPRVFSWDPAPAPEAEPRADEAPAAPQPAEPAFSSLFEPKEKDPAPADPPVKEPPIVSAPEEDDPTAAWQVPTKPAEPIPAVTATTGAPSLPPARPIASDISSVPRSGYSGPVTSSPTPRTVGDVYRTGRRSRRTIKHIEPWSILKVSVLFYTAFTLFFLLLTVILFYVGVSSGVVGNFESLIRGIGWPTFRLRAIQVFRSVLLFGVLMSIFWSAVNVLMAIIYNLVSDVVGGVEVQVTERD